MAEGRRLRGDLTAAMWHGARATVAGTGILVHGSSHKSTPPRDHHATVSSQLAYFTCAQPTHTEPTRVRPGT